MKGQLAWWTTEEKIKQSRHIPRFWSNEYQHMTKPWAWASQRVKHCTRVSSKSSKLRSKESINVAGWGREVHTWDQGINLVFQTCRESEYPNTHSILGMKQPTHSVHYRLRMKWPKGRKSIHVVQRGSLYDRPQKKRMKQSGNIPRSQSNMAVPWPNHPSY